jgi:hypothetical protein
VNIIQVINGYAHILKVVFEMWGVTTPGMSHLISEEKPNASHMCVRIKLHTYDRQNECNIIDIIQNVTWGCGTGEEPEVGDGADSGAGCRWVGEREERKVELGRAMRWANLSHAGEIGWRAREEKRKRKEGGPVEVWAERPGRGAGPRELLGRGLGKEAGLKKEKERGREEGF